MRSRSIVKTKQSLEVREFWGHLGCWYNYTQVHTSLSLFPHYQHFATSLSKSEKDAGGLGNGKRELKNPSVPGNHSRSPKHIHGDSRSLHRAPQLSAYVNTAHTEDPAFPSQSLTLLLLSFKGTPSHADRKPVVAEHSTVQHSSQEPSGLPSAGHAATGNPDAPSQQNTHGI